MGGISADTGLASGLPIHDIVGQLMSVESRPRELAEERHGELDERHTALQDVNSQLLALRDAAGELNRTATFGHAAATSSNENVLTAEAGNNAVPGSYHFHVQQLVAAQQNLTDGFADIDQTTFGEGTLTFARDGARLDGVTELARLNGGQGIERGEIRVTDRAGNSAVVDLSTAATVDEVVQRINDAVGVDVTARTDGDQLQLTDNTGQSAANLSVENVTERDTAGTLGLDQSVSDDTLTGDPVNTLGQATQLGELNDGQGVGTVRGESDLRITAADGSTHDVDLTNVATVGEVIGRINEQADGDVTAAVASDGVSLELTDHTGGGPDFSVTALNDSAAATDLGILGSDDDSSGTIEGHRLVAGLNSKLTRMLRGGEGVDLGTVSITDRNGTSDQVDLTGADSIRDITRRINEADADVTATLNDPRHGITITDNTGGSNDLEISDVTGAAASDLNLAGGHDRDVIDSGNLQLRHLGEGTRLDTLDVTPGTFIVTDSTGQSETIDLAAIEAHTVGDVIGEINVRGFDVTARINDTGDGILLEDDAGGAVPIRVEEAGATTAADLGLLGEAEEAGADHDGRLVHSVEIDEDDTLEDIAGKINAAGAGVRASIVHDGSEGAPYRLMLASAEGGTQHGFVFDDEGLGLGAARFAEAQDATIFFGAADPADALALRSTSNQLEDVVPDTTIDLHATSDQPVQLTIDDDHEPVVQALGGFVEGFNELMAKMDEYDFYDEETEERGVLLGDPALNLVRNAVHRQINMRSDEVEGQFKSLAEVGVSLSAEGELELDKAALGSALQADPDAVKKLFTLRETETDEQTGETELVRAGLGVEIEQQLERLTDRQSGSFNRQIDSLEQQMELNEDRIERLNERLERRREQLLNEFFSMEQAIAGMQQQSQALGGLQNLGGGGGMGGMPGGGAGLEQML